MGVGPHTPLIVEEEGLQAGRASVDETETPGLFESAARPRMTIVAPPEGETVVFYGASDDLVEVEGTIPGCDEYELPHDTHLVAFEVAGLRVIVRYHGTWGIEVSQIDEDVPVAAVTQRLWSEGYTMKLELRVPKGSHVAKVY